MQILNAPTENHVLGAKTFFSADEATIQTILSVDNAYGFVVADYISLGEIGAETSEVRMISAIAADLSTITVSAATNFEHLANASIQVLRFNQRKFYRSTTESGTYTHLSSEGSPIDIAVDNPSGTEFEDSGGLSTSWYKATYYNSTTTLESLLADSVASKAGDATDYTSLYRIRNEAGFKNNAFISLEDINNYRAEAQMQIDGAIALVYSLPLSSIPKIITHITTLLAAGFLLTKEYGVEADVEISKTGERKILRAEQLLQKIVDGSLLLVDSSGSSLARLSTSRVAGSNTYNSNILDKGEIFNVADENFKLTNPNDATANSKRISGQYQRNVNWSQK